METTVTPGQMAAQEAIGDLLAVLGVEPAHMLRILYIVCEHTTAAPNVHAVRRKLAAAQARIEATP